MDLKDFIRYAQNHPNHAEATWLEMDKTAIKLVFKIDALEAQNKTLLEALEQIARAAEAGDYAIPDDAIIHNLRDIAREAIQKAKE